MTTEHHTIDDLLEQLRHSGWNPPSELRPAIMELGAEAVPALIALVSNPANYDMTEDADDVSYWAPYPAVEILGELHPPEALAPLLTLITWDDYDYLSSIVPDALAAYGQAALDPLSSILADRGKTVWTRARVIDALGKMERLFPELRDQIVTTITAQLDTDEPETEDLDTLRGFLVGELVEMGAEESIPSIVRAFESTWIDPYIVSWEDARERLDIPPYVAPQLDTTTPTRMSLFDTGAWSIAPIPSERPAPARTRTHARQEPQPFRRQTRKIGRNEPCPCGSGKKYKKCHGR